MGRAVLETLTRPYATDGISIGALEGILSSPHLSRYLAPIGRSGGCFLLPDPAVGQCEGDGSEDDDRSHESTHD